MDDVVHLVEENRAGRSLRHSKEWHGKGGMFLPQNWEHHLGNKDLAIATHSATLLQTIPKSQWEVTYHLYYNLQNVKVK